MTRKRSNIRNMGNRMGMFEYLVRRVKALENRLHYEESKSNYKNLNPQFDVVNPMEKIIKEVYMQGSKVKVEVSYFKGLFNLNFLDWR